MDVENKVKSKSTQIINKLSPELRLQIEQGLSLLDFNKRTLKLSKVDVSKKLKTIPTFLQTQLKKGELDYLALSAVIWVVLTIFEKVLSSFVIYMFALLPGFIFWILLSKLVIEFVLKKDEIVIEKPEVINEIRDLQADKQNILEKIDEYPEIKTSVTTIMNDDSKIINQLTKSETSDKQELIDLHQVTMEHFINVVTTYFSIKDAPENFHDAEQRLETIKSTVIKYDRDLDGVIQKINENNLHDFEVALRMVLTQTDEG
jgi:hypothetical protein